MKKTTPLTPTHCMSLQQAMLAALKPLADKHGLVVETLGAPNIELGVCFDVSFRMALPNPDGSAYNPEREMFLMLAEEYGLSANDFGAQFTTGSDTFVITGLDPRRPKYPISADRISDRKSYKFTSQNVAMYLKAQKPKPKTPKKP